MKGNYIVINGKKAELTEEQLKALGIEIEKKTVFDRVEKGEAYYYIDSCGNTIRDFDGTPFCDGTRYDIANYCTDKALMEQRALHETLNRLLWRFSMEHDGDKIGWQNPISSKAYIYYNYQTKKWSITTTLKFRDVGQIYFYTKEIAEQAIEEIVKPFITEHPEFRL
jgi:hypothetical protein